MTPLTPIARAFRRVRQTRLADRRLGRNYLYLFGMVLFHEVMRKGHILMLALLGAWGCGSAIPTTPTPEPCPDGAPLLVGPTIAHPPRGVRIPIRPDTTILGDGSALSTIQTTLGEVNDLAGLSLYLERDPHAPLEDINVFMHINPGIANAAEEVDQPNGSASISFQTIERARREPIVLHELLHWVGLKGHSPIPTEIMCGEGQCDPNRQPSPRERALIVWVMGQPNGPSVCR